MRVMRVFTGFECFEGMRVMRFCTGFEGFNGTIFKFLLFLLIVFACSKIFGFLILHIYYYATAGLCRTVFLFRWIVSKWIVGEMYFDGDMILLNRDSWDVILGMGLFRPLFKNVSQLQLFLKLWEPYLRVQNRTFLVIEKDYYW